MLFKFLPLISNYIIWVVVMVILVNHWLEKQSVKRPMKTESKYKVEKRVNEHCIPKKNWYSIKKSQNIIKLIPISTPRTSPTISEDTRMTEISVRDVTFPELTHGIQCGSSVGEEVMKDFEKKVFDYVNITRIRPSFIASVLRSRLKEDKITFKGNESTGRCKVIQAINELEITCSLSPLTYSYELSLICKEILDTVDHEAIEEDPKCISQLYKILTSEYGNGERAKILYYSKSNKPENVIFDLMVNGSNGDSQREKILNPIFKMAGLYVHTENNKTIMLFICYCQ